MGLAAFNRMRLQRVEEMRPENIQKRAEEEKVEIKEAIPEKELELVEEPNEEVKAEAPKRGRRKSN